MYKFDSLFIKKAFLQLFHWHACAVLVPGHGDGAMADPVRPGLDSRPPQPHEGGFLLVGAWVAGGGYGGAVVGHHGRGRGGESAQGKEDSHQHHDGGQDHAEEHGQRGVAAVGDEGAGVLGPVRAIHRHLDDEEALRDEPVQQGLHGQERQPPGPRHAEQPCLAGARPGWLPGAIGS